MFIAALFTIAKMWNQPKYISTDDWIKKLWYMHKMEYYSALKRNEILRYVTTWMNLEEVILNEISQPQKDRYYMIPLDMRFLK